MTYDPDFLEGLTYAFGHLVSSFGTDAHAGDSADLAIEVMTEIGLDINEQDLIVAIAEYVHGNYAWTGEEREFTRRIRAGEA